MSAVGAGTGRVVAAVWLDRRASFQSIHAGIVATPACHANFSVVSHQPTGRPASYAV